MLQSLQNLIGTPVDVCDGNVGTLEQLVFEDEHWSVRQLAITADEGQEHNDILLPPSAVVRIDSGRIELSMNRALIDSSPRINAHRLTWHLIEKEHLHASKEVRGYTMQATTGNFGFVEDFLLDTDEWVIRYLVVDARNFWSGKRVLIAPAWVAHVGWQKRRLYADLSKEAIRLAPEYHPQPWLDRDFEERLYGYYGRPNYWEGESLEGVDSGRPLPDGEPPRRRKTNGSQNMTLS